MQQTVYSFTSTLNLAMSKTCTLMKSQIASKISAEMALLIKNNIDISTISFSCQKMDLLKQYDQDGKYDIDLLTEQIMLFDNDAEIYSYIQTEKQLCTSIHQFIELPFSLIKLTQRYITKQETFRSYLKLPDNLDEYNTKQKLDQLESKCLENLSQIKERRKKLDCCVICWEHYATHIIQPCMHLVVCKECINIKKCPMCKGGINQITCVFK